jgi:bifunctional non-homologous end joining protein LigD
MARSVQLTRLIKEGIKSPAAHQIKPMLCTLVKLPVTQAGFVHEIKWDGYRLLAHCHKGKIRLDSRSGLDYTDKYPPLVVAFQKLKHNVIFDGEAVVMNAAGNPDFDAIQTFNGHDEPIFYYAFDILWADGYNLMDLPLLKRKEILALILGDNNVLRYSEHFPDGAGLYEQMKKLGLEGIISKKATSSYNPGERGPNWYKTPTEMRQEFVIGGWIESEKGRAFRSLLFGAYKNKKLEWIGHAGGGFRDNEMPGIMKKLKPLEMKKSPFTNNVDTDGKPHWVKPQLVGNFKFATWTKSGRIRKPAIFLGFRDDKKAATVTREMPVEQTENISRDSKEQIKNGRPTNPTSAASKWPAIEKQKIEQEEQFSFGDCKMIINNIERKIWKDITKADLIQYYHSVSDYILPHIKDRPQSLHIKLINANAPGFYIKDMEGREPECASIFTVDRKHKAAGKRAKIDYLVANNEATLLYMINLGCIDINPWTSRVSAPHNPDYIIIDLDPSDEEFKKAIETAIAAKEFFDSKKLRAFIKTSGKTGMHLYLPCRDFDFRQARAIAENICNAIHELVPEFTTTAVNISSRGNKLYIDPNQNDFADTVAAPYAARPFHHPSVSTPLDWKEVKLSLDPLQFDIQTIVARIRKKGDLFGDVMDKKIAVANSKVLKTF